MAWEIIEHCCGHESRKQIYGPRKQREWEINNSQRKKCADCYDKERAEAAKQAAEEAGKMGLPDLLGSEAQKKWAYQIRGEKVPWLDAEIKKIEAHRARLEAREGLKEGVTEEQVKAAILTVDATLTHLRMARLSTSASYWIDRRGYSSYTFVREASGQIS